MVSADEYDCSGVIGAPPVHRKKVRKLRVIKELGRADYMRAYIRSGGKLKYRGFC